LASDAFTLAAAAHEMMPMIAMMRATRLPEHAFSMVIQPIDST
jgi:hypothetical protein